jgi:hypothetical protein
MDRMTTYEIHANPAMLRSAHDEGALLEQLDAPLRSMVSELVSRAEKKPLSIYLCSTDQDAELRNFFAYVLAMWVQKRDSTTLLVDCDFLATGMSSVVPHHDALGLLDLLLYGTSLGVITQEANAGVSVIGAGSFPVTKKCPFAMDAFENTLRYLGNHSKCVIYCGPVHDDDDLIHPIVEHVDLVMLINVADRFREGILGSLESSVASAKSLDAWSVRVNTTRPARPSEQRPVATPVVATPVDEPTTPETGEAAALVAEVDGLADDKPADKAVDETPRRDKEAPVPDRQATVAADGERPESKPLPETEDSAGRIPVPAQTKQVKERSAYIAGAAGSHRIEEDDIAGLKVDKKPRSSRWLRIVTPIVGIFLVAFVIWWLYLTKSVREREQDLAGMAGSPVVTGETTQPADSTGAAADTTQPALPDDTVEAAPQDTPVPAVSGSATHTQLTNGVPLAERLDDYANQYLVHVSSFRRLDSARDEALYLMGWEYPVFLYRIDLGGKGIWYRVYVGPAATRDEARAFKIKLDENPRIQSTRIARVPG